MTESQSRPAFEAWASGNGKWQGIVGRYPNGDYMVAKTQERWEAWQACAEAMNQPNQKKEQEMNNQKFDPTKPVQTREGKAVFVLKHDLKGKVVEILGYVQCAVTGHDVVKRWHQSGRVHPFFESHDDLVNVVPSMWLNLYPGRADLFMYSDQKSANQAATEGRNGMLELPQDGRKPILHDVGGEE